MGTHVVIGAGPVGTEVARQLAQAGESVILVTRRGSGPDLPGITRIACDASMPGKLRQVVPRADVLYNCANPEYHRWPQDWPPLASAFLDFAEQTGAVLATCSNLYGYGPVNGPIIESLPLAATGMKSRVRAQMWLDAKERHDSGRIRATEVRGSDYICPTEQSLIGSARVVPRILAGRKVSVVGSADAEHSWTSPADAARLLVAVAAHERGWGSAWHVPSNPPRTQRQVVDDLADAAGVERVPVASLSPGMLRIAGVFSPAIRELAETAYQRDRPFIVDDTAARTAFGIEPTPWQEILDSVIAHYRSD